jgi:hypothetical protein
MIKHCDENKDILLQKDFNAMIIFATNAAEKIKQLPAPSLEFYSADDYTYLTYYRSGTKCTIRKCAEKMFYNLTVDGQCDDEPCDMEQALILLRFLYEM